jgi:hypothetical protein
MKETPESIFAWQTGTFGETTAYQAMKKVLAEVAELDVAVNKRVDTLPGTRAEDIESRNNVVLEAADVYITLMRVVGSLVEPQRFFEFVDHKMQVNRARKWNVGPDGNAQHKEDV